MRKKEICVFCLGFKIFLIILHPLNLSQYLNEVFSPSDLYHKEGFVVGAAGVKPDKENKDEEIKLLTKLKEARHIKQIRENRLLMRVRRHKSETRFKKTVDKMNSFLFSKSSLMYNFPGDLQCNP